MGASLASLLNDEIDKMVDDETTREEVVQDMGSAAGIDSGTVNQILDGTIDCPPLERLRGFAQVLGASLSSIRSAAESDGCSYDTDTDTDNGDDDMEAATAAALKAAFPGEAEFCLDQIEKKASLLQAQAAFGQVLAKRLEERDAQLKARDEELAEAKKAAASNDGKVVGRGGGKAEGDDDGDDPASKFRALVAEKKAAGLAPDRAVRAVIAENPDLHREMLLHVNGAESFPSGYTKLRRGARQL